MTSCLCCIGDLEKTTEGIVTLAIKCAGKEITREQMVDTVKSIDITAGKPSPLLVDATLSHSVSFEALIEMAKAVHVTAVAIYAPSETAKIAAEYIELFQKNIGKAPYPFKIFPDAVPATEWLRGFL
jgi:hypothetical protein